MTKPSHRLYEAQSSFVGFGCDCRRDCDWDRRLGILHKLPPFHYAGYDGGYDVDRFNEHLADNDQYADRSEHADVIYADKHDHDDYHDVDGFRQHDDHDELYDVDRFHQHDDNIVDPEQRAFLNRSGR